MVENLTLEQKNRMTVHKDVRAICQEATHCIGMDIQVHAMELIAELAWKKINVIGADLECFAKHAKRSTINAEDVKLLVRRNPSLKAHISKLAEESATASATASRENKRKRGTLASATATPQAQKAGPSTSRSAVVTNHGDEEDSPFIKLLHSKINSTVEKDMDLDDTIDLT